MKSIVTKGIVLSRVDFQEADRILTILTPDNGKIRVLAKGVRKIKSKLAGGIELFSLSQLTFIPGRGEIKTLISSRMQIHFGNIVKDINRTMLGYEFLKRINKVTEDAAEAAYYELLAQALNGLNNPDLSSEALELWFTMQLLKITGHAPNLRTDSNQRLLSQTERYVFDFDSMTFQAADQGTLTANHIKLLRLGFNSQQPAIFTKVRGVTDQLPEVLALSQAILNYRN
ncbi:MAG TPA: DNA repair protein RecO [Candidatus Saccharimonadales bacterium]|nr:DNA repair protein RecO [Candidatus Saccharimonadales bacterium]